MDYIDKKKRFIGFVDVVRKVVYKSTDVMAYGV